MNKLVERYRELSQIPALIGAYICRENVILSTWSQRNLEREKSSVFKRTHFPGCTGYVSTLPIDVSNETLSVLAPSETRRAVIRDLEGKDGSVQYLEVWKENNLVVSVDLTALDLHGKVYTDGEFARFEWSPDETRLLYVAERKEPKKKTITKRPPVTKADGDSKKEPEIEWKATEYKQDWGEQLVGKIASDLIMYDVTSDAFQILSGIPEDVCPAQPIWGPNGEYIIGVGYKTSPRKLGLIFCTNRLSTIFKLDLQGNYWEVPLENKSVKCPRFTPDFSNLLWLQRSAEGAHHACMQLVKVSTDNFEPEVVIDLVQSKMNINSSKPFYGLYNTSILKRCWINNEKLLLSTNQRNSVETYIVDIVKKTVTELEQSEGSQIVLDVFQGNILINRRNFFQQDELFIGTLPTEVTNVNDINWTRVTQRYTLPGGEKYFSKYFDLSHKNGDEEIDNFTAIFVGPLEGSDIPLILMPHGGPHSSFANNLSLEISYFLDQGYAILMVNYRGSTGSGQDTVDFLRGRVGSADVADCVLATKTALETFPQLSKKVGLCGGSHGGFLATHLSGQHPDLYQAAVTRNPVIDIASMSIVSDIPDWCLVEGGFPYTQVGQPNNEQLVAMRNMSPIVHAHKVKAPTLLQLGVKDLRVPPSQSIEYYHRLKSNGVKVSMNVYEDNHSLSSVPNEMNNIISTILWMNEHLIN